MGSDICGWTVGTVGRVRWVDRGGWGGDRGMRDTINYRRGGAILVTLSWQECYRRGNTIPVRDWTVGQVIQGQVTMQ